LTDAFEGSYTRQWLGENGANAIGRTNYLGMAGWCDTIPAICGRFAGAFTNRSETRLSEVEDGQTATLAFGEAVGGWDKTGTVYELSYSWMGAGALVSVAGLVPEGAANRPDRFQFSSEHEGVVLFVSLDGHVGPLKRDIDKSVFRSMSGIRDGELVDSRWTD
jgi:hypothetical protein